ncbi:hypothetical protein K5V21_06645 [Clostridium sardiniense]|uniref:Dual OB-containing domain-containing protein n=1 Tax=Clostridium sardiniense TaxID=29369 RepID=A0ABS7KWD0_CLOSR|nr:hypothetical protein [Clostridium sardiniense]MBY0755130.1 hypothetical protein [Clostridium sardiniense]MDQ0459009.1 hypothetical protein [Clostridium sardiniense]
MKKKVIILTRSDKNGGYCVAGIDVKKERFIRLVSDDEGTDYALTDNDIMYEDGTQMQPMEIIEVELLGKQGSENQPENYIIDDSKYFEKVGKAKKSEIREYLMKPDFIFYNSEASVLEEDMEEILDKYSLVLFRVDEFKLWLDKFKDGRITANFNYNDEEYRFIKITDHTLTDRYYDKVEECSPRPYVIKKAILVMSLAGVAVKGKYYKLVANIIEDNKGLLTRIG